MIQKYQKYFERLPQFFPNWENSVFTIEGLYSITPYEVSDKVSNVLKTYGNSVLETCCGIGGDTLSFSKNFERVYANDINKANIEITKCNLSVHSTSSKDLLSNVTFNSTSELLTLPYSDYNIIFFDPPWGGPSYKNNAVENDNRFDNFKVGANTAKELNNYAMSFQNVNATCWKMPKYIKVPSEACSMDIKGIKYIIFTKQ